MSTTTPPTDNPDREKELLEQSERINRELVLERQLRVADAAKRALGEEGGRFQIRLKIPTGKKVSNPFGGEEIEEYEEEGNKYEIKSYHFHKITANDWNLYMLKRGELNNETIKPLDKADNTKIADLNNRIYEYLALKYLGMKHDEFVRADWDDVRLAVDACNYVTEWQSQEVSIEGNNRVVQQLIKKPPQIKEKEEPTHEFTKFDIPDDEPPTPTKRKGKEDDNNSSTKKLYDYDDY